MWQAFEGWPLRTQTSSTPQRENEWTRVHTTSEGYNDHTGGTRGRRADRGKYAWQPLILRDRREIHLVVTSASLTPTTTVPGRIVLFTFFLQVLETYGIQLVHLSPNSVVVLAVFAHLCKMFMGVAPSATLLRHFFVLSRWGRRGGTPRRTSRGAATFGSGTAWGIITFPRCCAASGRNGDGTGSSSTSTPTSASSCRRRRQNLGDRRGRRRHQKTRG